MREMIMERDENGETIKSIAVKLLEAKSKNETSNNLAQALFLLGSKNSGKSTLVNLLLDKSDKRTETLGLEYTFGKKNVHGHLNEKNVCHIWELGGDMFKTLEILKVPYSAHKHCPITIVLCLDLSQPKCLWSTLDYYISNIRSVINNDCKLKLDPLETIKNNKSNSFFPSPLLIVGSKYDIFSSFDINTKRGVCKLLRSVALITGANLIFFNENDTSIRKKTKDLLSHIGFGTEQRAKGVTNDYNKALFITSGNDTWESIGIGEPTWDTIKSAYVAQFPQTSVEIIIPEDPSLEANYREPLIDSLRNEKDDALKMMLNKSLYSNIY